MSASSTNWKDVGFWVLSSALALTFLMAGATKVLGAPMQVETFARLGLPDLLRPFVGSVEVAAAVLLFVPRTRFWGASALVATMAGAALTHLVSGVDVAMVGVNVVLLALSGVLAWADRPSVVEQVPAENGRA